MISKKFIMAQLSDLDYLIDLSLEKSGSILPEDKELINKKAANLGLDTEEVALYLDAKCAKYSRDIIKSKQDNRIRVAKKGGNMAAEIIKKIILGFILLFMICFWPLLFAKWYRKAISSVWGQILGSTPTTVINEDD